MRAKLEQIETRIRRGQIEQAALELRAIPFAELNETSRPQFAALARRANLVPLSLKVLAPAIRGELARGATPEESLEYAAGLLRLGVRREAIRTLERLELPMARLHMAFGHFAVWDYASALPHLERFVTAPGLTDYQRMIGRTNLAATLAALHRLAPARRLTEEVLRDAHALEHARIRANLHEIRAQIDITEGDFEKAERDLEAAASALGTDAPDAVFVRKWSAIATSLKNGDVAPLANFRAEALRARDWESVREADFFRLRVRFDESVFQHLWFGTPHAAYRERLARTLGQPKSDTYLWGEGPACAIEPDQPALQRVFEALTRDLYRPTALGTLFEDIFPNDRFDIFSSPNRLHQLLWRLRGWLALEHLPLAVEFHEGAYALARTGPIAIRLGAPTPTGVDRDWLTLQERLGPVFNAKDVEATLGVSRSTARRLLQWAESEKGLRREGRGRAVTYRKVA